MLAPVAVTHFENLNFVLRGQELRMSERFAMIGRTIASPE